MIPRRRDLPGLLIGAALIASPLIIVLLSYLFEGRFW